MRGKNRCRSTISKLPPEIRDVVDEMVKATNTCTLKDIQEYLASQNVTLSVQAISNYGRKLMAGLEQIRVTNERMNAMIREAAKYPELDFSEVINRIASQKILDAILSKPDEEWNDIALDTAMHWKQQKNEYRSWRRRTVSCVLTSMGWNADCARGSRKSKLKGGSANERFHQSIV